MPGPRPPRSSVPVMGLSMGHGCLRRVGPPGPFWGLRVPPPEALGERLRPEGEQLPPDHGRRSAGTAPGGSGKHRELAPTKRAPAGSSAARGHARPVRTTCVSACACASQPLAAPSLVRAERGPPVVRWARLTLHVNREPVSASGPKPWSLPGVTGGFHAPGWLPASGSCLVGPMRRGRSPHLAQPGGAVGTGSGCRHHLGFPPTRVSGLISR